MKKDLQELIEISRFYGKDTRYVIAGGGNTSMKTQDRIWVKASGYALSDIGEEGFAVLDRGKLKKISTNKYAVDPFERERRIKEDLMDACITKDRRPSVETSLHDLIPRKFVVHLHPALVNGLMCGNDAEVHAERLFGGNALYIPYTDPGYILFKEIEDHLQKFRAANDRDPEIILLQNHGIFVSGDSTAGIRSVYEKVFTTLEREVKESLPEKSIPVPQGISEILPAIRMMLSEDGLKTLRIRNNALVEYFTGSEERNRMISSPFTPDIIVYCKSKTIYCEAEGSPDRILKDLKSQINAFRKEHGCFPKVILVKGMGLIAAGENAGDADIILDVFEDMMKISWLSGFFGGPHFMSDKQIQFIDTWDVENYRRKAAAGTGSKGRAENRTIIVTGGAMGFGAGIAKGLFKEGANIVIADINEDGGKEIPGVLRAQGRKNQAAYVQADVSDPESLENLIFETVKVFGGFDVFISNAGILRAGGLEEMDEETFDLVTKINYNAYFYCVKYAAPVLKLQQAHKKDHFTDIIQINSKSGLTGSRMNFAYAGGKFGGLGLTQSFALELAPHKIKVNSICPGNFFEGPLWSDPENGLFIQYLNTGKVPGAKNIDDVRKHYESQVPMGRGCRIEDVLRAVLYVMEQKYETGQAVPVTGGQNMLR